MKASDRAVLLGLVIVGIGAAFWFLALAPKREEASTLKDTVAQLESEVDAQEQLAATAEQARDDYEKNYTRLVSLGKAAPADGDTPSLIQQLGALAKNAGTDFRLLELAEGSGDVPVGGPAQTTADPAPAGAVAPPAEGATPATPVAAAAPATEAAASMLPIGASVGPAGLGVLPYKLQFSGDFFQVADLMQGIDSLVGSDGTAVEVDGRLLTVNGFTMTKPEEGSGLDVELSVTSYVLPGSQGLTAGATETAPPATVPAPTPVSTTAAP